MSIPENIDFSFVRYANCWEDADILCAALQPAPGKRLLSIASAGDNSLSLLAGGGEVVAADLNPAQLACCELRRELIRLLGREEFMQFAGIQACSDRLATYRRVKASLSQEARDYWDSRPDVIANGFIHSGKFEHYFQLFRRRIIPLIHSRKTVSRLLAPKSREEQMAFYDKTWNNWRWQVLFKVFFSRFVMGRVGRDPEFFRHVEGGVSNRILARTRYALTELETSVNPYLGYILTGNFGVSLPHYLQEGNYRRIKANIDGLVIRRGAIDEVAEHYGPESFDGFNLSDIFEYLSTQQYGNVYSRLLGTARPGARFAYWNMLVPRACPDHLKPHIQALDDEASRLFKQDRAFFYSRFIIEQVQLPGRFETATLRSC